MASERTRDWILLGVAGIVFFVSSLVLASVDGIFLSPDETGNAFFAETFATQVGKEGGLAEHPELADAGAARKVGGGWRRPRCGAS